MQLTEACLKVFVLFDVQFSLSSVIAIRDLSFYVFTLLAMQ